MKWNSTICTARRSPLAPPIYALTSAIHSEKSDFSNSNIFRVDFQQTKKNSFLLVQNVEIYKCAAHHHLWSVRCARSYLDSTMHKYHRADEHEHMCICIGVERRREYTELYRTAFCSFALRTCTILWISLVPNEKSNTFEICSFFFSFFYVAYSLVLSVAICIVRARVWVCLCVCASCVAWMGIGWDSTQIT